MNYTCACFIPIGFSHIYERYHQSSLIIYLKIIIYSISFPLKQESLLFHWRIDYNENKKKSA